jgi:hypothetical protein
MKILFLIPVHEKNEIVEDTIRNITSYNPNDECFFTLIVNEEFQDFDEQKFSLLKNVLVVKRTVSSTLESLKKYISQIKYLIYSYSLSKEKFNFDYVVVFHTSQLFVKKGYSDYIKNYDTSLRPREWYIQNRFPLEYRKWTPNDRQWNNTINYLGHFFKMIAWKDTFNNRFTKDEFFEKICEDYQTKFHYLFTPLFEMELFKNVFYDQFNLNNYHYQCIEESFYKKEIFDYIEHVCNNELTLSLDEISNFFTYANIEEIIIPTLAVKSSVRIGNNTLKWIENIDCELLDTIEDYEFSNLVDSMEDYQFSIKSVPRDVMHPVRNIVRNNI